MMLSVVVAAFATSPGASADPTSPQITVDRTAGLDGAGDTITVTGTGFIQDEAGGTDATRAPLCSTHVGMGVWDDCTFGGVYIVFGRFAENWRPSEGASGTSRVPLQTY